MFKTVSPWGAYVWPTVVTTAVYEDKELFVRLRAFPLFTFTSGLC